MLIVLDDDGIWHEVYNKTEIRSIHGTRGGWVENWEVRTLCCTDSVPSFCRVGTARACVNDNVHAPNAPTCIRCIAMPCDHDIIFDEDVALILRLTSTQVRKRWPRLDGVCKKGCGYEGIFYASRAHYVFGDW